MADETKVETVAFEVIPIDEAPERSYTKSSKYDPIIDSFLSKVKESGIDLGQIKVTRPDNNELLESNYLRTQLHKRIVARKIEGLKATVINDICHLTTRPEDEKKGSD